MEEAPCDLQAGGVAGGGCSAPWLAVYTRPRHEQKVQQYCRSHGIAVFWPCYRSWRQWSDRRKLLLAPLFPSYVFIRPDIAQLALVPRAPGLLWVVHNRSGPVAVDSLELEAIQRLLQSGLAFDPLPNAAIGDEVEIVRGAMRGCRGWLLSKQVGRIALRITAIQGGIRVYLPDPSWVVPIRALRAAAAPHFHVRPEFS